MAGASEVKVVDGSTATLPDTSANQKVFPQQRMQKPGCGFPIMRFVGLFSLATGCLVGVVTGEDYYDAELSLFRKLWAFPSSRASVLLADRHFSDYGTLAALLELGGSRRGHAHGISNAPGTSRQGQYLRPVPADRLITWKKPAQRTRTVSLRLWGQPARNLDPAHDPRPLRHKGISHPRTDPGHHPAGPGKISRGGNRPTFLATLERGTVLSRPEKPSSKWNTYAAKARPWCKKELFMHLIGYNLIRAVMLQSAAPP